MQFVFSPSWFSVAEICIIAVSALVAFLLAAHILRIYSFTQETRHKYLSAAFALISVAFVVSAATKFFAFYNLFEKHGQGIAFYTFNILHSSTTFLAAGELVFRFLMLCGLLAVFHILMRSDNKKMLALDGFFAGIITLFSITHYYVFYAATFAVGALITYHFLYNYFEKPSGKTASMLAGFGIITICQAAFVLSALQTVYVQAGLLQLLGYIMLLATYIQLRK